jgi:hypothetical protein
MSTFEPTERGWWARTTARATLGMIVLAVVMMAAGIPVAPAANAQDFDCNSDLGDPAPGTPEWDFAYFDTLFCRSERPSMTSANDAYFAAIDANDAAGSPAKTIIPPGVFPELPNGLEAFIQYDPFRDVYLRWAGQRGDFQEVTFTTSSGAVRKALLLSPLDTGGNKPLPGIVLACHVCAFTFNAWQWAAQALAEHGYVVMYADVAGSITATTDATDYFVATPESPSPRGEVNPWHARLDRTRLGIMGHSGGASIALRAGHNDPRYDAIVAWDPGAGVLGGIPTLRTPTMVQVRDFNFGPAGAPLPPVPTEKPVPAPGERYTYFDALRAAGVDTMQVAPRGSTHADWLGVGGTEPAPMAMYGGSTRYGEQVATYYTLAWFDRYLRGAPPPPGTPGGSGHAGIANGALQRLTAPGTFDDSSDEYSIGTGFFDADAAESAGDIEAGNVPITIEGLSIRNRLSFWYPTRYFLDGGAVQCEDLRSGGCPPLGTDPN